MATVPNMRAGPAPVAPGTTLPTPVGGGEFASLLPGVPEELLQVMPAMPAADGTDGDAPEAGTEATEPADSIAPSDAAQLAALLPIMPVPVAAPVPAPNVTPSVAASEVSPPSQSAVRLAKAPAAPVAKAPVPAPPVPIPGKPETAPPVPGAPKSEKASAPNVAAAPDDSKAVDAPTDQLPEAAKRVIEQALRQVALAPVAGSRATVRPQNAPVEREAAPAIDATSPLPAATPLAAAPVGPSPVTAPAPTAAPQAVDRTIERELDLARDGEWLDRLARDIATTADGDAPMRFRLHPQTLGSLRVELAQGDHGTSVRLTVETETARAILTDAQPRLAAEARAQGVRIAETHVDLAGSGRHAAGDQRRQDETRQSPMIRTAREAASGGAPVQPARSRSDRYA